MGVKDMIARHISRPPDYTIAIDTNKKEIISEIVEILQRFKCERCAGCCKNAGIDLSPDEAIEMLRQKGNAYFDMLDANAVRDRLKAPCGLLKGTLCSVYEKRPLSCKVYPFAWDQRGLLLLYQCQMDREVTEELAKFAKMSGFNVEKADSENGAQAIGLDGKVISAAIVPYTLLRQYYESVKLNGIPVYIRHKI
jgi:Fe-S-cluster containining protein